MALVKEINQPPQETRDAAPPRRRRTSIVPLARRLGAQVAPPLVVAVALILVFQAIYALHWVSPVVLPAPFDVGSEIAGKTFDGTMWKNMWVTTKEGLAGFAIGSVLGIGLGALIGLSRNAARGLYPYVILLQSMPRIALVPVFVAMFGFGITAKIVTAVILAFFPPLVNTIVGLREVDQEAMTLLRSLCASKRQIMRKLLWPSALPAIFAGLKTGLTLGFLGAFVAELTAANEGAGLLIDTAANQLEMALVFAYVFWFSVLSLVLYGVLEFIDGRVVFWKESQRHDVLGESQV